MVELQTVSVSLYTIIISSPNFPSLQFKVYLWQGELGNLKAQRRNLLARATDVRLPLEEQTASRNELTRVARIINEKSERELVLQKKLVQIRTNDNAVGFDLGGAEYGIKDR
jgi:hypothetical protein